MPDILRPFLILTVALGLQPAGSGTCAAGQSPLAAQLEPLLKAHPGQVAVCVRHLETGEQFAWRAEEVQPTASLIKLAVMVTAYRMADAGQLDLNRLVRVTDADKVPGSGILTDHFSSGLQLPLRDAIRLMIRYSDNTATNLVIDQTGLPATAEMMETMGYANTKLHAKVYRGSTSIFPERSQSFGLGSTTARETVELLAQLHQGTAATAESCSVMLEHLRHCEDRTKLARELRGGTQFAHKTGAVNASRTDAGILFGAGGPVAICVLTTDNADRSWDEDNNSAHLLMGRIGRIVQDHFHPAPTRESSAYGAPLQQGSFGEMVEMLQRTLNARMEPSPGLSIDGDFGPGTESAVRRFQQQAGLAENGIVDAAFWKALGPVVPPEVVPPPEIVNADIPPRADPETLNGPPVVTCRAWTIVDLATGHTLWSDHAGQPLDIASTTKIMSAWLVIRLAEQQPEILNEVLTFSERADQTIGSTSGLKAGEQIRIQDALYGLMLPSGNDMSVALAEYFGPRLVDPATGPVPNTSPVPSAGESAAGTTEMPDPLDQFVEAMNVEATRLGMRATHFCNPHGLTADNHLSTAEDLALLARTALNSPLFQQYVNQRRFGVTVNSASGYQRNVVWENTNQLLGIEGYHGVKTGTTDRAGACLVSAASRGDRRLLMVVLGSAASASRYADSRNLYRWAWSELEKQ